MSYTSTTSSCSTPLSSPAFPLPSFGRNGGLQYPHNLPSIFSSSFHDSPSNSEGGRAEKKPKREKRRYRCRVRSPETIERSKRNRRDKANARERRRMNSLNDALENLRTFLPAMPEEPKMTKIETLRVAQWYISMLQKMIDEGTAENVEDVHEYRTSLNRREEDEEGEGEGQGGGERIRETADRTHSHGIFSQNNIHFAHYNNPPFHIPLDQPVFHYR